MKVLLVTCPLRHSCGDPGLTSRFLSKKKAVGVHCANVANLLLNKIIYYNFKQDIVLMDLK